MMRAGLFFITSSLVAILMSGGALFAAPIGVPGATTGKDQSTIGVELNFLIDRDLDQTNDTEGMTVLAKGQVGVSERIDLLYRFGFGHFETGGEDSDAGSAFGFGTKVTWASIKNANLKIGSVAQMLQIRADVDGQGRKSFQEYDFALGAYIDADSPGISGRQSLLTTYGGFVFSGLSIEGGGSTTDKEEDSLGIFAGLLMKMNKKMEVGVEVRLLEQTALAIYSSFAF